MVDGFSVDLDSLGKDADQWRSWRDDVVAENDSIVTDIELLAFSTQPGFPGLGVQYLAQAAELKRSIEDGGRIFGAIADRIDEVVRLYSEAEAANAATIARLDV